jgi:uncharacterized protein
MLFSGYASIFNVPDDEGDIVRPGAFTASVARRGTDNIRLLYQHQYHCSIGKWLSIFEDDVGLAVTGSLDMNLNFSKEIYLMMTNKYLE